VAGASAWLISWAADGVNGLTLAGLVGVVGGIGWAATRAIFQTESLTAQSMQQMLLEQVQAEEEELDRLDRLLSEDNDPRDQEMLRAFRALRAQFHQIAGQPGLMARSHDVLSRIEQLFRASVNNLYECYKLWRQSQGLRPAERNHLMNEREKLLHDIHQSVAQVQHALTEYRDLSKRAVGTDMSQLREELETSLQVAKRTEERLRELDGSPDYDNYLKEPN
jgi:hypothetical protein